MDEELHQLGLQLLSSKIQPLPLTPPSPLFSLSSPSPRPRRVCSRLSSMDEELYQLGQQLLSEKIQDLSERGLLEKLPEPPPKLPAAGPKPQQQIRGKGGPQKRAGGPRLGSMKIWVEADDEDRKGGCGGVSSGRVVSEGCSFSTRES